MARKAFVAGQIKRVSHPDDKDNPTIYVIQCVPYRVKTWVSDHSMQVGSTAFHAGRVAGLGLQVGLLNVENLQDEQGNVVKIEQTEIELPGGMKHKCVADSVLDMLPQDDVPWLLDQIRRFGEVAETDAGKSAGQS